MARTVALDARTLSWVRARFEEYYASAAIDPPARLARREFAYFPFTAETMMRRHTTLPSPLEFHRYLAREVPRHVYYSSAYYRHPADAAMAQKEWMGADLIFDLDADHLRGAEKLSYADQLARVKERLAYLVDDFLVRDFAVDPAQTTIVFSGGRGYHVHVRDDPFVPLRSPERREIVDYILGEGVAPERSFFAERTDVTRGLVAGEADAEGGGGARRGPQPRAWRLAPSDAPGWQGRITRALLDRLGKWERDGAKAAAVELTEVGIPPRTARAWAKRLLEQDGARKIRERETIDVFGASSSADTPKQFADAVVKLAAVEVQGETDAPVTTDIHRLIRLPNSRHGGTGLRVVPLSRDELKGFDPFRDALVAAPDGASTHVTFTADVAYPFPDGGVRGRSGATDELPTPVATFLLLRGEAALPPSPA